MKGRISMVSLGAGPRCHGSGRRYWRRKNTERWVGRQCHLSTHNTQLCTVYFASTLKKKKLLLSQFFFESHSKRNFTLCFFLYSIKNSCVQFKMFDENKSSPPHLKHEVYRGRLFA